MTRQLWLRVPNNSGSPRPVPPAKLYRCFSAIALRRSGLDAVQAGSACLPSARMEPERVGQLVLRAASRVRRAGYHRAC
jgi:hypothetical protein